MQPPEDRHLVEDDVLDVDDEIEDQHGEGGRQPQRNADGVEQAPSAVLGNQRDADRGQREQGADQQRIEDHDPDVGRPAVAARDGADAPRKQGFQRHHQGQDAEEDGDPDHRFVAQKGVGEIQLFAHRLDIPRRPMPCLQAHDSPTGRRGKGCRARLFHSVASHLRVLRALHAKVGAELGESGPRRKAGSLANSEEETL